MKNTYKQKPGSDQFIITEKQLSRHFVDNSGNLILALNKLGHVIMVNAKAAEVLGYTTDELIGQNWFESFLPDESTKKVKAIFNKMISGEIKASHYAETPVIVKDGSTKIIAWHNTLLKMIKMKFLEH
ncbi:MAG: PAS domain S-box protein [Bacteroidales bacterium]